MNETANPVPAISRHRPFVLFWFARGFSSIALQMQVVAVGWQIYELTGSAFDLGLVGLVQFIPVIPLMLVAGHTADRYPRRPIVRLCQAMAGLAMAGLALGTMQGWLTRDLILALVLVLGAARAFEAPTLQALLAGLVPPPLLPRAVAGSASANQLATIAGPALGGIVYALSPTLVYAICAALFIAASILISFIRGERFERESGPVSISTFFAGISFIRHHPVILGAISLDLFAVLLGGTTALLPIFARDVFHIGPWGLGVMRTAPALGALAMALILARRPLRRHAGAKMFGAVAIFGVATLLFAISEHLALSLAVLVVLGAADMVSVVMRQTLVQIETPDAMRGRVNAVNSLFIGTSNQLGEFRSGVTAAAFGTIASVLIGGAGTLLVAALWLKAFPALARIDRLEGRSG